MNNWLIGTGIILSVLVAWGMLTEPKVDSAEAAHVMAGDVETNSKSTVQTVQYDMKKKAEVEKQTSAVEPLPQKKKMEKLTLDEGVLYQGTDVTRRYGFQVIDTAMPSEKDKRKFTLQGEMEGHRFVLKIPLNAMNDPLQLRIVDRKNKRVKTIELGSGSDFETEKGAAKLQMSFSDPQSYEVVYNDLNDKVFP